ncbi:MAG: glycosyltransferase family 9 protein [Planctomycetes bacterium]|nr:glycosyltransferase family 9 protein [Planctomycetota bacterium]
MEKPRLDHPRRILLIELLRIGDILVKFPTIAALRQRFPEAHITLLTTRLVQDFVEPNPNLSARIYVDDFPGWRAVVARVRTLNADTALILDQKPASAALALLSGAPTRVGYDYRGLGGFMTHAVPCPGYINRPSWDYPPGERVLSTIEYWLRLLEPLGVHAPPTRPRLFLSKRDRESARQLLGQGQRPVCLHPGASSSSYEWHPDRFAEVAARLSDGMDVRIAITGSQADVQKAAHIAALARRDVLNLAGKTTLGQLAAVFERAALLISVDTSAAHIGAALGVNTVVLFGAGDPRIWGTYGELDSSRGRYVAIQGKSECLICKSPTCRRPQHHCMDAITVEMVLDAARKLLGD